MFIKNDYSDETSTFARFMARIASLEDTLGKRHCSCASSLPTGAYLLVLALLLALAAGAIALGIYFLASSASVSCLHKYCFDEKKLVHKS